MTEGIIQQVFKKYMIKGGYGFEIEIHDNTVNVIPQTLFEQAFKELIEKIKQEFPNDKSISPSYQVRQVLIGDNQ